MIDPDPFTQTYEAIWRALAARAEWVALVKPGLRADKDTPTGKIIEQLKGRGINGVVALDQAQYQMQPFGANSLVASAQQTYVLSVASSSPAIVKVNETKWQTFLALRAAGPQLALPQIVSSWVIQQAMDRPQLPAGTPGAPGYASVLWIIVNMTIDARLV